MFGKLFKKKCEYCKKAIKKGKIVKKDVKVPEFVALKERNFCCEGHSELYDEYVRNLPRRPSLCPSCPTPPDS